MASRHRSGRALHHRDSPSDSRAFGAGGIFSEEDALIGGSLGDEAVVVNHAAQNDQPAPTVVEGPDGAQTTMIMAPTSVADGGLGGALNTAPLDSLPAEPTPGPGDLSGNLETASVPNPTASPSSGTRTGSTLLPSSTAAAQSTNNGPSAAAKAAMAIGALAGVLLILAIIYLIVTRRKKSTEKQRLADEKLHGPMMNQNPFAHRDDNMRSSPAAPRISLRPVTQFLPGLAFDSNNRGSRAGVDDAHATSGTMLKPMTSRAPGASAWERPRTPQSANAVNPFGVQAERLYKATPPRPVSPLEEGYSGDSGRSVSPLGSSPPSPPAKNPFVAYGSSAHEGSSPPGAATGLVRKASRRDAPRALDLTLPAPPLSAVPPSPAGTEFSISSVGPEQTFAPSASAAAIAAAGGPASSTVHRVQLDFKPTLDDELGVKAGQLVRLLHEYDDGWALCLRMDRSQQGVVPRTCLSTRPVKPRPNNGPNGRVGPPVNPSGPRMAPPGQVRPESPERPVTQFFAMSNLSQRGLNGSGAASKGMPGQAY